MMDKYRTVDAKVANVLEELASSFRCYLKAATEELEIRTFLMKEEYQEVTRKSEAEQTEQEKQGEGMMRAPFGYCPRCNVMGRKRDKKSGMDTCWNEHTYPSNTAVLRFDKEPEEESHVNSN